PSFRPGAWRALWRTVGWGVLPMQAVSICPQRAQPEAALADCAKASAREEMRRYQAYRCELRATAAAPQARSGACSVSSPVSRLPFAPQLSVGVTRHR